MPATMTYTGMLVIEECCKCHITFAMPKDFQRQCRETGERFCCPLGHSQVYTRTELDELKDKLAREQRWRRSAEANATHFRDQAEASQRSARAYRGQVTKIKRRVGNGVCPCCNRTFPNLASHMSTQHPDFREP